MIAKHTLLLSTTLALTPSLAGCIFGNGVGNPGDTNTTTGNSIDQDIAQYDSTQKLLEQHRQVFKKNAMEPAGVGNRLFWLEFPGFDPSLHSLDATTGEEVDYVFAIGTGDTYNYRASENLVVTVEQKGDKIVYHAFDVAKPGEAIGELALPTPGAGIRWWAYAPDKTDVYYVTTESKTTLWKWTPGQPDAKPLFDLEDTGAQLGEFWDFGVDGNTMVFIEAGRIWSLDIAAKKSTWLGNETESSSAYWDASGVLFSTAKGPFFYGFGSKSLTDISDAIATSDYQLNDTFSTAHLYDQDLARSKSTVGYIGNSGFFTYDMDAKKVSPILLDARDNSVTYRYPVILDNGTMFVQGLESTSGSIGADGPLFRVDP